ncbi:RraA family protein [Kocuria turfanensis]|uniref:RraA family protein n=1 Tax=Kocuria turfanensis TaxID=388357 RepID=UPI004036F168
MTTTGTTDSVLIGARGHSSATLYEAAHAEARARRGTNATHPGHEADLAVDPTIRAAWAGARIAAPAYTVQGAGGDNLALHHAVANAPAGHVLVADLGGASFGHWGEVLAVAAQQRGIVGLVIDGGVRDVEEMRELGFPVFSCNNTVRGTRKLFPGALGADIHLGGVPVATGDLVVADADGVVIIPRHRVQAVLEQADERIAKEQEIFEALRSGATTLTLYGLE